MLVTPYFWVALSARVGDEAVLGVLAPGLDLEAGGLDRRAVAVALHRAADAGGPERGVAGDALGQLLRGDDVGEREAPARAQRARRRRRTRPACRVRG